MEDVDPLTASIFGPYPPYGKSNKKKTESERPSGEELVAASADITAKRDFKKALEKAGGDSTKVLPPDRYKTDGFYRLSFDIAKSDHLEEQEIDKRNLIRKNKEKEWETEQNSESWNKAIKNKNSLYERIRKPIVSFVKGGNYKEETNTEFFKRKVKPYKVLAAAGTTLAGLGAVAHPAAIGVLA